MLSNPEKRTVYDVYGEEGLRAGLALSTDVRDVRSAWQRFQAKQVRHTTASTCYARGGKGAGPEWSSGGQDSGSIVLPHPVGKSSHQRNGQRR